MAGKRARGGFSSQGQTPPQQGLKHGDHPVGYEQPAGLFGQSAHEPLGALTSAAGVESIADVAADRYPQSESIATNRLRNL